MADVTCLGILVADAIAKPVTEIPDSGKLSLVDQIELHTGGCATNAAIDLIRMGMPVSIVGKVGNDGFGRFLQASLVDEGVDVRGLKMDDDSNTSASIVLVSEDGERSFIHCLGSNATFDESDIDYGIIKESKILFVAGALLMPNFDGEPTARVLKWAKDNDIYTVLDTAWDSTGRWMKAIGPCLPYLDLFMPSIEEAKMLTDEDDVDIMADVFLEMGAKNVVIKMGHKGCFIKNHSERYELPVFDVEVVDTTGAGDAFVAGFITGLLKGWDLKKSGIYANAVGAHCVMEMGASNGIRSLDEIVEFIIERNGEF
ncbi:MAG: carbohydrate kinase family protein [Clostridiales bacterium]|nr:carbohydrate kinase family protein [Clostridiales bacterium]